MQVKHNKKWENLQRRKNFLMFFLRRRLSLRSEKLNSIKKMKEKKNNKIA